jgi:hypothetical protein
MSFLQHLAPREVGRWSRAPRTLRQGRHPRLQRRGESVLRPLLDIKDEAFDKIMGSNVKSNIWPVRWRSRKWPSEATARW